MKTSIVTRVWAAVGLMLLIQVAAFGQGINIERVQRDFQARYHQVTGGYVDWPKCNEANGTPAPHFPKDGFYGDILLDPAKGVELVRDLAKKFDRDTINDELVIYDKFVNAPNGYATLDAAPPTSINNYGDVDMLPGILWSQVDENNYLQKLQLLETQMAKLTLVKVEATQVVTPTADDKQIVFYNGVGNGGACNVQLNCALIQWSTCNWGKAIWGNGPPVRPCDHPNNQIQFTPAFQPTQITRVVGSGTGDSNDGSPDPSFSVAGVYNTRGKISADLRAFDKGTVKIYLKLSKPSIGDQQWDFFMGRQNNPPWFILDTTQFGQSTPTISPESTYGEWTQGGLTLGIVATTDQFVTHSDAIPTTPSPLPCVFNTLNLNGWKVQHQLAIVAPDFTSVPDPQDCCSAECDTCEPGEMTASVQSLHVNIPLGTDNYGGSAGALTLSAEKPSLALATIAGLSFTKADSVVKISGTPPTTTRLQFKTSQALFDIQWVTDYKYTISVYSVGNFGSTVDGTGFYPPTGPVSSTTTIENPDALPTSFNKLRLTRTKGGNTTVTDYIYTAGTGESGEWQMITGGNLRKESRNSTWAGNLRTETVIIRNATDQIVSREVNIHKRFPWGQELIQKSLEATANGPALTATWSYYENPTTDIGSYSRLKEHVGAYGNWMQYEYDAFGRETKRVSQFQNTAVGSAENLNRVVATSYATTDPQITTIETLLGQEIGRHYQVVLSGEVRDIVCQTPGALWTAADNLITATKKNTTGQFKDELQSIENPDGTMQLYTYAISGGQRTDTVESGVPNGGKTAITDGTRTVTVKGSVGQMISRTVTDILSGITVSTETYSNYDEFNRPRRVTYLDGTYSDTTYSCCGVDTTTDRDGVVTQYLYDALKRQDAYVRHGIMFRNILDAEGRVLVQKRIGTDTSEIVLGQTTYDVAGRVSTEINGLNGTTTYVESFNGSNQRVRTTTYPDTGTRIETYNKDGTLQKVTGTAVFAARYEYGIETTGVDAGKFFTEEIKLLADQVTDSSEWTKTYTDALGRSCKTIVADSTTGTEADNPFTKSFYNNKGQLAKTVDQDGVTTLFQYNLKGEREYTAVDLSSANNTADGNGNFPIDLGVDRVSRTVSDVFNNTTLGYNVRRSQTEVYPTDAVSTPLLVSKQEVSTSGLRAWQTVYNYTPSAGTVTTASQTGYNNNDGVTAAGYRTTTTTHPDLSKSVSVFYQGRLLSTASKNSSNGQLSKTTYLYDVHGRAWKTTDARNGTTTFAFNNADQITSVTTPNPGTPGGTPQTSSTEYNTSLQAWRVTQPDGTTATSEFFKTGLLKNTYGSRTYPVEYEYDYAGRMKTMKTWQNFAANSGTATTTWNYNPYRGWLDKKVYQGETDNTLDYEYLASGRLWKRHWERGVTTTYGYNIAGDLETVTYSNDPQNTPTVGYTYDRRGRQKTVTQGSAVTTLTYNDANEVLTEGYTGGTLNGLTVTRGYDTKLRRNSLSAQYSSTPLLQHSYVYDPSSGRLQTVSDGVNNAAYGYLANSPLVNTVTFRQNTTTRLTTTKSYDFLNRLTSVSSSPSSSISFGYQYNQANQRTRNTTADGSYWSYEYDSLGQVKRGAKFFSDGYPVPGQQFEYGFDDIGNRKSTKAGGDENGANLRSASYTPNALNQYSSRDVPRKIDVMGLALGTATVTATSPNALNNATAPWRKGEYFRKELSFTVNTTPLWELLTVTATSEANVTGNAFLAGTPEAFGYDLDGNLTSDGRWTYTWDAENRLVRMVANTAVGPQQRLDFEYDASSRRIGKKVWNNTAGSGSPLLEQKFVYDGWNLLAILNSQSSILQSFLWGLDLSGSLQGAGGVGGLLAVKPASGNALFVAYDGNGNVMGLVDATTGTKTAEYAYGPFGEPIQLTPNANNPSPFRFSTKYQDEETGLLYYGSRYLDVLTGRWLNGDTIEEAGGVNLYAFAGNDGLNLFDYLGREPKATPGALIIIGNPPPQTELKPGEGIFKYTDKTVITLAGATPPGLVPQTLGEKIVDFVIPHPLETYKHADAAFALAANPDAPTYLRVSASFNGTSFVILGVTDFAGLGGLTKPLKRKCIELSEKGLKEALEKDILRLLNARERQLALGNDPIKGFIQAEGTAGFRLEQALGRKLDRGPDVSIDIVDKFGDLGNISLKGPIPKQGNVEGLAEAAIYDAMGGNTATKTVVIDTLGLSQSQTAGLKAAIEAGTKGTSKKIIYLH